MLVITFLSNDESMALSVEIMTIKKFKQITTPMKFSNLEMQIQVCLTSLDQRKRQRERERGREGERERERTYVHIAGRLQVWKIDEGERSAEEVQLSSFASAEPPTGSFKPP